LIFSRLKAVVVHWVNRRFSGAALDASD